MKIDEQDAVVILPVDAVGPSYRDEYPGLPTEPVPGLRTTYLSPIVGAPELVIPSMFGLPQPLCAQLTSKIVGQILHKSRITLRPEPLPVVVAIMGTPGSDVNLLDEIVDFLKKVGRPTKVKTGKEMFGA